MLPLCTTPNSAFADNCLKKRRLTLLSFKHPIKKSNLRYYSCRSIFDSRTKVEVGKIYYGHLAETLFVQRAILCTTLREYDHNPKKRI